MTTGQQSSCWADRLSNTLVLDSTANLPMSQSDRGTSNILQAPCSMSERAVALLNGSIAHYIRGMMLSPPSFPLTVGEAENRTWI